MESEKDALKYCLENPINYLAFSRALRSPDHLPQIAAMIHREVTNAKPDDKEGENGDKKNKTARAVWGRLYYGCMKSGYFCEMDREKFFSYLRAAFTLDPPKRSSYFEGVGKVETALNRDANSGKGQAVFDRHKENVEAIARRICDIYKASATERSCCSGTPTGRERD